MVNVNTQFLGMESVNDHPTKPNPAHPPTRDALHTPSIIAIPISNTPHLYRMAEQFF